MEGNTINYKYVEEVNVACARNRQLKRKETVPKYQQELGLLIQSTFPTGSKTAIDSLVPSSLFQKRADAAEELKYLNYMHTRKAQEVFAKEEVITCIR